MTHPALTAEQRAALAGLADQIRAIPSPRARKRFEDVWAEALSAAAELVEKNLLADLDSKQVTPRQIERIGPAPPGYKWAQDPCHSDIVGLVESAHESNSKAWDLSQEQIERCKEHNRELVRLPSYAASHCPECLVAERDRADGENERLRELLGRIARWDHMDTAADGAYWRAEIYKVLDRPKGIERYPVLSKAPKSIRTRDERELEETQPLLQYACWKCSDIHEHGPCPRFAIPATLSDESHAEVDG